ncbi:MAG: beta-phosphoglucomutase family hydrolase [Clostridia bacterium]|nr:beta-phosphoglucomutase family hydrolase [Clostridia bacterium]
MRYRGVIFAMDGIICSTDRYHIKAWQKLADRLNVPFDVTVYNEQMRGLSRMDSLEVFLKHTGLTCSEAEKVALSAEKHGYVADMLEQLEPDDLSDEVRSTMRTIRRRGVKLGVGSSSTNVPTILRRLDLATFFDAVCDGNTVRHAKPDPEVFQRCAGFMGLTPSECLVVENANAGVQAALGGRFHCAALGDAKDNRLATYHLKTFADLAGIVD